MTICVYNTNPDWIATLRAFPALYQETEVNFWRKDVRYLTGLPPGSEFVFRVMGTTLIVGKARFARQENMSIGQAWNTFGRRNGVESLAELIDRAGDVLNIQDAGPLSELNCIVLNDVRFFKEEDWKEIPAATFPRNILGAKYFANGELVLSQIQSEIDDDITSIAQNGAYTLATREQLIKARVGQGEFRRRVLAAWEDSCAVTGCSIAKALRASHVKPWRDCTVNECLDPYNGLPLVASLDALFDGHLITFLPSGRMVVSCAVATTDYDMLGLQAFTLRRPPQTPMKVYLREHRGRFLTLERARRAARV